MHAGVVGQGAGGWPGREGARPAAGVELLGLLPGAGCYSVLLLQRVALLI